MKCVVHVSTWLATTCTCLSCAADAYLWPTLCPFGVGGRAVAASLNLRGSTNKSYSDHQIGEEHGITNAPTATSASATSTDTGTSTKAEASEGYTGYGPAVVSRWAQATILVRRAVTLAVGLWIAYLSYPVVNNILSPNQAS